MPRTYGVTRLFRDSPDRIEQRTGLSLKEAQEHCRNPETSSSTASERTLMHVGESRGPWFDCYEVERHCP